MAVCLFTNKFPYKGGEPFLETEIHYLSQNFDRVDVFPMSGQKTHLLPLPTNVQVHDFDFNQTVYLRKLVLKHGWLLVTWFVVEVVKSPHRFKYLSQLNWNFKRLAGLLNNALALKKYINDTPALKNNNTPILYSYWFNEWASILVFAKCLGLKGKFITRTHGYDFDEQQQGRGYHPFRYKELPEFDKVFQVSEYGQNYILQRFKKIKNLKVAKLGVNDKGTNPIATDKIFQIVSCSNFVALKRVHLIAAILSHLKVPFYWTHFGSGAEMNSVETLVRKSINENSYSFKGYVANSDLMSWYQNNSIDLFVNVSNLEGLPVSLMEAISFGIPVVGCKVCGVPEIVTESTGVLLDVDFTPEAVALTIEKFLLTQSRNLEFREGVKQFWRENFDADKNYKDFIKLLKN